MSTRDMTAPEARELVEEAKTVVGGLMRSQKQRVARESAEMYASLVRGEDKFHHQARLALHVLWLAVLRKQHRYADTERPLEFLVDAGYFDYALVDGINMSDHYLADMLEAHGEFEKAAGHREAFAAQAQQRFGAESERTRMSALRAEATRARADAATRS
ncbi:hypothetical protein [Corynebacterium pilosum]|uniref:Uncharacterized protein n=1 Tax=Corynebacterium pilosum TaxID=35756 RepID=A0A376CSK7_9CORY|nr:hypothetical protein [Corynebacterium pilosum]STC70618.1 Uncharacterised protein [Corynebacterium pilosum]